MSYCEIPQKAKALTHSPTARTASCGRSQTPKVLHQIRSSESQNSLTFLLSGFLTIPPVSLMHPHIYENTSAFRYMENGLHILTFFCRYYGLSYKVRNTDEKKSECANRFACTLPRICNLS